MSLIRPSIVHDLHVALPCLIPPSRNIGLFNLALNSMSEEGIE